METAAPITQAEADYLYGLSKELTAAIQWEERADGSRYLLAWVEAEDGTQMTVRGWVGRKLRSGKSRRFGFSLLVRNCVIVRRWDQKPGHYDPVSKRRMDGPHKHYPMEDYADSPSYATSDVRTDDADKALVDFLKECKISQGKFPVVTQRTIGDFGG